MTDNKDHEILKDFGEGMSILSDVKDFTAKIGEKLELLPQKNRCIKNALIFTSFNNRNMNCIYGLIKRHYWAQLIVILRWHLEMVHKSYYLIENPSEYVEWLRGKKIRAKDIGEFFKTKKFNSKYDEYLDWSDIVHFNYKAIRNTPIDGTLNRDYYIAFINRVLFELMEASHKANYNSVTILKPHISLTESNLLSER